MHSWERLRELRSDDLVLRAFCELVPHTNTSTLLPSLLETGAAAGAAAEAAAGLAAGAAGEAAGASP